MAERLVFDLLANDRASAGFVAAGRAASAAADNVKGLTHRLDEISRKSAEARVGLKGDKDALAQLDKLDVKLLLVGKRRANPNITLDGALKANLEIAALSAELDKLGRKTASIGSGGGGLGSLFGAGGGLAGLATSPAGIAGITVALGGLLPELAGLVSGFAAAGAGVGAFGLLALPTFHKIQTAYTGINAAQQAYNLAVAKNNEAPTKANAAAVARALVNLRVAQENMAPSTRTAVTGIQGLVAEFGKMAKAFQPDVMKIFNDGLRIAHNLLPDLKPFADAAATAIDGLLKQAGKFTQSTGFRDWLAQFQKLSGPAITAIGEGIGKVALAVGKLLSTMSSKDVVHAINIAFDTIAGAIRAVAWAVRELMKLWDYTSRHVMHNMDDMTSSFRHWATNTENAFRLVRDVAKMIFLGIEIAGLTAIDRILGAFSHIPVIGHYFASAHAQVSRELAGIEADSHRTWGRVQGDLAGVHGKVVDLSFKVLFPSGVAAGTPFRPTPSGHAKGTGAGGAAPGWSWVGEQGPELIHLHGGEHILSNPVSMQVTRGYAAGTDDFRASFPSAGAINAGTAGMQAMGYGFGAALAAQLDRKYVFTPSPSGGGMAGPGGGAPASNAALARHMYPAYGSGSEFAAWNYVAMRESGWNQFARNPGSGAYGIPQALPESKLPFAGQAAGGSNPAAQISWMFNYMLSRYGGPVGAMIHERDFNWYDQGGYLMPGLTLAMNGTGKPEPVGVTAGRTYNISVQATPLSRPADTGRAVVDAIKAYERGSGPGWRS